MLTRASSKRKNQPTSEAQSLKTPENLAELPTELLEKIFGYVTHPVARLRLSETCKRFLAIIRSQSAPNYMLRIENMEEKRIVASIFRRASANPVPFTKLRFCVQNDEIPTKDPVFTPFSMDVVEISVEITKSRLDTVIDHIGRRFPNVRKLSVTINHDSSYNSYVSQGRETYVSQGRENLFHLDELEVIFPVIISPRDIRFLLNACRALLTRFRLVFNLDISATQNYSSLETAVINMVVFPTELLSWTLKAENAEVVIRRSSIDFVHYIIVRCIPSQVSLIQLLELNPYLTVNEFKSVFWERRNIETLKFSFTDSKKPSFFEFGAELSIEKIQTILDSGSTIRVIEFPDKINFFGVQDFMELLTSIPGLEWIDFGDKQVLIHGFLSDKVARKIRSIKWFDSWYDVQRDMTFVKNTLWRMENLQKLTLGTKEGGGLFKDCINDFSFQLIIQKLRKLKHLDIYKSQLTDAGITGEGEPEWQPIFVLADLEHLQIGRMKDNAITNKSFNEAIRFPNLKTFIFKGKITNEGVKMLVANNKCIEGLSIQYSDKVDGKALDYVVEHLPYLRELEFVQCGVQRKKGEEFHRKNPFARLKLTIYD